jgi:hypothetical protein
MPKNEATEKESGNENSDAATKADKKSRSDEEEAAGSDLASELEPVRTRKGEPADNLRRRAEWFQKRTGGG